MAVNPWRHDMQRVFDHFYNDRAWLTVGTPVSARPTPKIDSYVEGDEIHIKADFPGIDPKDVEISLDANQLTLKAERKADSQEEKGGYFHREISYGSFERSFVLPRGVDVEKIAAISKNGTLEVVVPLPKSATPKRIMVDVKTEDATAAA
jgi:HSP20 family protein